MDERYYKALALLAELAGDHGTNTYSVTDYAFGFIPFKNGENKVKEVGTGYSEIAHWLIDEGQKNFEDSLREG